jgi:hypothetical protein
VTARDIFDDDLVQERYFDDVDEYGARDVFEDNDFDARDYLEADEYDARDFEDAEEELMARSFSSKLNLGRLKGSLIPPRGSPGRRPSLGGLKLPLGRPRTALSQAKGKIWSKGAGNSQADSVSTRELLEEVLDARDKAEEAAERRKLRKLKLLALRKKGGKKLGKQGGLKKKGKKLGAGARPVDASAPVAEAAAPAPAA